MLKWMMGHLRMLKTFQNVWRRCGSKGFDPVKSKDQMAALGARLRVRGGFIVQEAPDAAVPRFCLVFFNVKACLRP